MIKYDNIWVSNRFRYRKTLKGTRLTKHPVYGYLEPVGRKGFTAEKRKTFIDRFKICSNMKQIADSIEITMGSIYDAIAVDDKFREDINACNEIPGRSKKLNNELKSLEVREKNQIIADLGRKLKDYE